MKTQKIILLQKIHGKERLEYYSTSVAELRRSGSHINITSFNFDSRSSRIRCYPHSPNILTMTTTFAQYRELGKCYYEHAAHTYHYNFITFCVRHDVVPRGLNIRTHPVVPDSESKGTLLREWENVLIRTSHAHEMFKKGPP